MQPLIAIKGSREGLRLLLDTGAVWAEVLDALRVQLGQGASFFNGAQIIVDVGERALDAADLSGLMALMAEHGLTPEALASSARASRDAARAAGVTAKPVSRAAETEPLPEPLLIQRTLRSGQLVRHQGNVTIIGDVNAGAEIIAGGSVVVFGRLRGNVHAGALGDRAAVICALEFAPVQLRIADLIAHGAGHEPAKSPEIAQIEQDQITVVDWRSFRR